MELKLKKKTAPASEEAFASQEAAAPGAAGLFVRKSPAVNKPEVKPEKKSSGFSWGTRKKTGSSSGADSRSAAKGASRLFLCEPDDLQYLPAKTRERVYLMGDAILFSLQPLNLGPEYLEQPTRNAAAMSLLQRRVARPLYVYAHREVLGAVLKSGAKPVFALDAVLRYGLRLRGADEQAVVAAAGHGPVVHLLAVLFRKAEVADVRMWRIVSDARTRDADLHLALERLRLAWPNAQRWHWCGPLPVPLSQSFVEAPENLWSHTPAQSLTASGRPSLLSRFGAPVGLVLASAAISAAMVWPAYQDYLRAASVLASESQSLTGQYAFASQRLQLLKARQEFFRNAQAPQQRLKQLETLLQAVGQQNLKVKDAQLYAQSQGRGQFELLVEVEAAAGKSFLEQSKDILEKLAADTGAKLWLAQNDAFKEVSRTSEARGSALRQFRIQGDFADGS
ncbi:MAG: hypothetical protein P3W96_006340 [Halomonas sp.]|nr:hypothetical protein [Halomonas sp.]MDM7481621.1 hypothetical protein [Halomonas sp.]